MRHTPSDTTPAREWQGGTRAVLLPIKAFAEAKRRLHAALTESEREALARAMADRVMEAAASLPVAVVCDDADVASWAHEHGALVIWEPGRGLNRAVESGVAHLRNRGIVDVIVAHADLPRATDLASVGRSGVVTIVPDRFRNGTNVIALPTASGFCFSYGPGSFARHAAEASRIEHELVILDRPDLAWDIDVPDDLVPVRHLHDEVPT